MSTAWNESWNGRSWNRYTPPSQPLSQQSLRPERIPAPQTTRAVVSSRKFHLDGSVNCLLAAGAEIHKAVVHALPILPFPEGLHQLRHGFTRSLDRSSLELHVIMYKYKLWLPITILPSVSPVSGMAGMQRQPRVRKHLGARYIILGAGNIAATDQIASRTSSRAAWGNVTHSDDCAPKLHPLFALCLPLSCHQVPLPIQLASRSSSHKPGITGFSGLRLTRAQ
jgi:hypothetical protein